MRRRRGEKRKMGRTPCCDKSEVKKGAWTPEEDKILFDYITTHGHGTWRSLPKLAGLLRCGKSCRLRWTNYLRPDIKRGPFTPEEQATIIQLHSTLGNKWAAIATHLPRRTDNEIKNFWNSHLKKHFFSTGLNLQTPPSTINLKSSEYTHTRHLVQWENARVEAEARLSNESSLNPPPLPEEETNSDYFLRLWNSDVGESFRKINNEQDHHGTASSSLTKEGSGGSGVTHPGADNYTCNKQNNTMMMMEYMMNADKEAEEDMMGGSVTSSSLYELDDSCSEISLKMLLDFPSGGGDMGFL